MTVQLKRTTPFELVYLIVYPDSAVWLAVASQTHRHLTDFRLEMRLLIVTDSLANQTFC